MSEERTLSELRLRDLLERHKERNYGLIGVPRNRVWREAEETQHNKSIRNSDPTSADK